MVLRPICVVVAVALQPYCDRRTLSGSERTRPLARPHSSAGALWRNYEADLSTECAQAKCEAWFSCSHEHSWGACSDHPAPPEEADAALRVIEALSGRRSFERLRAEGVRRGRGPLRLVSRPAPAHDPTQSARIGFAISRTVGNAVQRNRIRRRVRAVLRDISRETPSLLPPGDYLFRVTSSVEHWSGAELRNTVDGLLRETVMSGAGS